MRELRKGILELAILGCLNHGSHYGYSLIRTLSGQGELDLTEGTIYPILSRLAKEGLVQTRWVESRLGPPRKYYSVTAKGRRSFEILNDEFQRLVAMVQRASAGPPKADVESKSPPIRTLSVRRELKP